MSNSQLELIKKFVEKEPYVNLLNLKVLKLEEGHSVVEMKADKKYNNIFSITHGGAIFSLVDVAFGSAANSYGNIAVALSMSINYIKPARAGQTLTAEATQISRGKKISVYNIIVKNSLNDTVASCQATAYLKKDKLPILKEIEDNT